MWFIWKAKLLLRKIAHNIRKIWGQTRKMHVIFWTFFCFVRPSSTENDEYSSTSTSICLIQKFSRYVCIYNTCWRILKKCKRKPQIYYHINTCERAFQRGRLKRSLYYQEQEHTRRKRATIIRAFNGKIQVMNPYNWFIV